jgi:hypothetical protein
MEEHALVLEKQSDSSWKLKTLVVGGALGLLVGVGAAFLLTKRAEQKGVPLAITPGKGVQLGVMLAGLLRSIMNLGEN